MSIGGPNEGSEVFEKVEDVSTHVDVWKVPCKHCLQHTEIKRADALEVFGGSRDGLLKACQYAYRKHHKSDDSIGWEELSDILLDALCNAMGAEFVEWNEKD